MNKLTLDEAIIIAKESSEDQCIGDRGREDYKQLAAWLEELERYRAITTGSPYKPKVNTHIELKRYKNKECKMSAEQMFTELGFRK